MISGLISIYLATLMKSLPQVKTEQHPSAMFQNVLTAAPIPQTKANTETSSPADPSTTSSPAIQASAYIVVDLRSGKTLSGKKVGERRAIGSITKLMTALIVLDENNLNDIVKVPESATKVEGSRIWLAAGEKITIRDLIYGLLIHSGNDAAYTLAIYNSGSIETFVAKMNDRAQKLGLKNTHFTNPAGLDRDDNYSTAEDIALLGSYAYRNSFIRYAVSIPKITVMSVNQQFKHELESTNVLLTTDPRFKGLKTGYTLEAGHSFVGVATLPNNATLLTVVLDSPDRFKESVKLVNWAAENYNW